MFPTEDNNKESQEQNSTKRQYERVTREEFEDFLDNTDYDWISTTLNDHVKFSGELVYGTTDPINDDENDLALVIFSTIDESTGKARSKGSDAIRTVVWSKKESRPVGGKRKTLRIKTWRKNLRKKIKELANNWSLNVEKCSKCSGYMVKREGQYGEFLGCTNYPECEETDYIE